MPKIFQDLSNFSLPSGFRGKNFLIVQLWWIIQSTLFTCSPQSFYGFRRLLLRIFGAEIGRGVIIRQTVRVTYPWKLTIGDYSWIGDNVELYTLGEIEIGNNVVVSQKCYLCTASHDYKNSNFEIFSKKIIIKHEAWLATDVFVAPGITIGKGTVIGARSSVFSDMPEGMVCVGYPAKPIKSRVENSSIQKLVP